MNQQTLTRAEAKEKIIRHVQVWLDNGLCEHCALILAAKDLNAEYGRIKAVWTQSS